MQNSGIRHVAQTSELVLPTISKRLRKGPVDSFVTYKCPRCAFSPRLRQSKLKRQIEDGSLPTPCKNGGQAAEADLPFHPAEHRLRRGTEISDVECAMDKWLIDAGASVLSALTCVALKSEMGEMRPLSARSTSTKKIRKRRGGADARASSCRNSVQHGVEFEFSSRCAPPRNSRCYASRSPWTTRRQPTILQS